MMDAADFEEEYGIKVPEKDNNDMVFYCKAGLRSQAAMVTVRQMGYNK